MRSTLLGFLAVALLALSPAALVHSQNRCPGGVCPVQLQPTPVAAVVADVPHVRCIAGNSCGSGTICGADSDGAYIVTNAHVTGTALGRQVSVDCVVGSGTQRVSGRTVMTGYSDARMVDFSIVFVEGLSSKRYMPMLKAEPDNQPYATTGSPKCVWPQVPKQFTNVQNYGDGLITGLPNAIGGQSGSAIFNAKGQQIALLTWSMNGRCAGQKTLKLWQVASQRNVQLADPRPVELRELGDCEFGRPATANGVFGDCVLIERAGENYRPVCENTIANVVGSAMEDLPIWVAPGDVPQPEPDPIPDCPPCPECPKCPDAGDCVKLTPNEAALIEFLRAQKTGLRDGQSVAYDWVKIMQLIMQLIQAIQEGRMG